MGGAAFEQGALSVLTWLATERFPVATLPGHLGFMRKFLPLPTAAAGPLNQDYQDRNLIMPPLIVHGMGENGTKIPGQPPTNQLLVLLPALILWPRQSRITLLRTDSRPYPNRVSVGTRL